MSEKLAQQTSPPLISSVEGFPAKTSPRRAEVLASLVLEAASGTSTLESLRSCARDSLSSKTSQAAPRDGLTPSAQTWNGSAMKRYRSLLAQLILAHPTAEHAFSSSGLLPTATASGADRGGRGDLLAVMQGRPMKHHQVFLPTVTASSSYGTNQGGGPATAIGSGPLNPTWLEWFMGFPDGWTEKKL